MESGTSGSQSGGVEDAGLQTPPVVDRNGAPASPTLPAELFAIQCELQPEGTSVIRAPDSQCFYFFASSYYCSDLRASLLVDPTYVYLPLVVIVIPYPIFD